MTLFHFASYKLKNFHAGLKGVRNILQILGLRPKFDTRKNLWENKEVFFERGWRAVSVANLFGDLEANIRHIPPGERWNLFYTLADCFEVPGRKLERCGAIAFDIDKVEGMDRDKAIQVGRIVCETIGVPYSEAGIVFSGNGTHVIIGLKDAVTSPEWFDQNRGAYRLLLDKIEAALWMKGFEGAKADPAVFNKAIIMRLPGTENRKPDKNLEKFPGPDEPQLLIRKPVEILQSNIIPQDFNLKSRAGILDIPPEDHIETTVLKKFPRPDADAVLSGCEFLKACKSSPGKISEPEWYASLSILSNLYGETPEGEEKARALCHDYSRGHPGYSLGETDAKINQARSQSGPRTCKNINAIWGGCKTCPYYEKILSPITIKGANYIKTRDTGFHFEKINPKGELVTGKPDYEGLRRYFNEENPYIVINKSSMTYRWTGMYWEPVEDNELKAFAQKYFKPTADNRMAAEFVGIIHRCNMRRSDFITDTTFRKMNFKNGVLDIDTMDFVPHSQEFGFRAVLPYEYDPGAVAPRFEAFLNEVTLEREDLQEILLEFAGYAFSNDECWAQKALILTGMGQNGKSIFLDLLKSLGGKENCSSVNLSELKKPEDRFQLEGKAFNLAEETPKAGLADSTIFKNLVTGGDMLVKFLYHQSYTISNRAKLIMSCNEMPSTSDLTAALFRRMIIVPFEASFEPGAPNHDPFIAKKLKAELPGIFNLVIAAYKRLCKNGKFTEGEASKAALDNYRTEQDSVIPFYRELIKADVVRSKEELAANQRFLFSLEIYERYVKYCNERGVKPSPYNTFSKRIHRLIPMASLRQDLRQIRNQRGRGYVGLALYDGSEGF